MSYFWIPPFSWDHCYEEWPPLPHSPCLLFLNQIVSWLLHELIVPWSSGLAEMFSLALEPEQWLASAGRFEWTYESLYFSHVKTMTKLTKVRQSKLQIDRMSLDCPATSRHGMATFPALRSVGRCLQYLGMVWCTGVGEQPQVRSAFMGSWLLFLNSAHSALMVTSFFFFWLFAKCKFAKMRFSLP